MLLYVNLRRPITNEHKDDEIDIKNIDVIRNSHCSGVSIIYLWMTSHTDLVFVLKIKNVKTGIC